MAGALGHALQALARQAGHGVGVGVGREQGRGEQQTGGLMFCRVGGRPGVGVGCQGGTGSLGTGAKPEVPLAGGGERHAQRASCRDSAPLHAWACPPAPPPPPILAQGIEVLSKAVEACKGSIEGSKGRLVVKEAARAVSEKEEKALDEQLQELENSNRCVGWQVGKPEEGAGQGGVLGRGGQVPCRGRYPRQCGGAEAFGCGWMLCGSAVVSLLRWVRAWTVYG
jgi:hypothetical protein